MKFREYEKIHRLGKEEVEGILDVAVYVQEKIDGANTSIWMDPETKTIQCGSRTRHLPDSESFNGFTEYAKNHAGIKKFFEMNPALVLYGEWLVRHTIQYQETAYRKFYLFDIYNPETDEYLSQEDVIKTAQAFKIDFAPIVGEFKYSDVEGIKALVGKSSFGDRGEGVVIKPVKPFKNKFGSHVYAKLVTKSFKEDNAVVFEGNNKHSDTYWEVYFVNKFITLPRVQKVMNKLQPTINEKLDMKHIPRIMGTVYHDMITEEGWEIANEKQKIDFGALKRIADKKTKQIFIDILNDSI